MCKIAQVMFDRNLTDLSGGNISVQVEDRILVTPSLASNLQFWILKPEEILILDLEAISWKERVKSPENWSPI